MVTALSHLFRRSDRARSGARTTVAGPRVLWEHRGMRSLIRLAAATLLAAPSLAQVYSYDDGTTENALNFNGVAEIGFMHSFDAPLGDVIGAVDFAIGTALAPAGGLDGRLVRVCVWEDPQNNQNPAEATLLFESPAFAATQTNSDTKVSYALPQGVAVDGRFYVGVIVETAAGEFPVGLDSTGLDPGETGFLVGDATAIDAANLANASVAPGAVSGAVFLIDAQPGGPPPPLGGNYCTAVPNSTGVAGRMVPFGSSIVTQNNVTLAAEDLPPSQFGIFIVSRVQGFIPQAGGTSNGNLCVGGQIGRFVGPGQILNSGPNGRFELPIDLSALPQGSSPVAAMPGESWSFQAWHRDGVGAGSNFTDGFEIQFQ